MSHDPNCTGCGRRLPDEVDEDGMLVFEYMCQECQEAQDLHYEGRAS